MEMGDSEFQAKIEAEWQNGYDAAKKESARELDLAQSMVKAQMEYVHKWQKRAEAAELQNRELTRLLSLALVELKDEGRACRLQDEILVAVNRKGPDPKVEAEKAVQGEAYEKCQHCDFHVGHEEACCNCDRCKAKSLKRNCGIGHHNSGPGPVTTPEGLRYVCLKCGEIL